MFELAARGLSFFYDLTGSYGTSIILFTSVVMLAITPFAVSAARGGLKQKLLKPQIAAIKAEFEGDSDRIESQLRKLHKDNRVTPAGGCIPVLLQLPLLVVVYRTLIGLTRRAEGTRFFDPLFLDESSQMFQDLSASTAMSSFGLDLSLALTAVAQNEALIIPHSLLYASLACAVWGQNKLNPARVDLPASVKANPKVKRIRLAMRGVYILIVMFVPAAIVLYFTTQTVWRGLHHLIVRVMVYDGEDSLGKQVAAMTAQSATSDSDDEPGAGN